ncbi:MAG: ABC transporter permease [Candidatus Acidiferrales bacterium]
MLDGLARDFRYSTRMLLKKPRFTAIAVLTLALGIGASTAMFSVIDNVLINPLPYKNSDRIVAVQIHNTSDVGTGGRRRMLGPEFLDYAEQSHSFEDVIGGGNDDVLYTTKEGTEQFDGGYVTANTFDFLGVPAMLGRTSTPDDVKPGAPPVFVLSYLTWVKSFGRDPSIVGKSFVLNDVPTILVGIMPPHITKLGADLWIPVNANRGDPDFAKRGFTLQAHLKPGITKEQAAAELNGIAVHEAQVYPNSYPKHFRVQVVSMVDNVIGDFRATLYVLAAAVGLLMLIACSNVANMLLAQATAREKEMAIRSAMGAGRWRIIRQLLIESFLLALGGAALGCVFAYGGITEIVAAMPVDTIPGETIIRMNAAALAFALVAAILTAVLFGLVPALQVAKRDFVEPLKDSGRGVSGGFRRGKFRSVLVVVEVALSLVLLAGAGVLMHAFVKMVDVDLGFDPNHILFTRVAFPRGQYTTAAEKQLFFTKLLARMDVLPGVVATAETTSIPPFGGVGSKLDIPGKVHSDDWRSVVTLCTANYFPTLGMRLLRGRLLTEQEVNDAQKVAVVNQTLVTKYFGNENPIGQDVTLDDLQTLPVDPVPNANFEIVGVVSDVRNDSLTEPTEAEVLVPATITGTFYRAVMAKTVRDPNLLVNPVRDAIWAVDRNATTADTGSLEGFLEQYAYAGPKFALVLMGIFAGLGLVLVSLGVYSVTAYTVSRQTHEIGIRMALGAGRADVLRMVMWMGLQLVTLGVGVGLLLSVALSRVIASQLSGASPRDPVTLAAVAGVLIVVGCAACYFPARRATRVDPMVALRYE